MGHNKGVEVAKKLGNALCAETMPFSIASGDLTHPGGSGFSSDLFKAVNVAEIENMAKNGFKYIFIMGDHGGGQAEMKEVAAYEDKKLSPTGVRVAFISDFYTKSHEDFNLYSYEHHIPIESHAGVMDTSEMLYEEPIKGMYVRDNYKTVPFDPGPEAETWKKQYDANQAKAAAAAAAPAPATTGQRGAATPRGPYTLSSDPVWIAIQTAPAATGRGGARGGGEGEGAGQRGAGATRVNNGITGDPHMATKELGRMYVGIVVDNAVNEIHKYMATFQKTGNGN
jgi:creatinine amidohydrolase/Fe(II)-dependent formamide hydrolase-like protein